MHQWPVSNCISTFLKSLTKSLASFPLSSSLFLCMPKCFCILLIIIFFFSRKPWFNFYGTIFLPAEKLQLCKTPSFQIHLSMKIFHFKFHDPGFEYLHFLCYYMRRNCTLFVVSRMQFIFLFSSLYSVITSFVFLSTLTVL